jgi:hypothetical protein
LHEALQFVATNHLSNIIIELDAEKDRQCFPEEVLS